MVEYDVLRTTYNALLEQCDMQIKMLDEKDKQVDELTAYIERLGQTHARQYAEVCGENRALRGGWGMERKLCPLKKKLQNTPNGVIEFAYCDKEHCEWYIPRFETCCVVCLAYLSNEFMKGEGIQ